MNLFIYYPKCSTCQKVKQFLEENNIPYLERDIKVQNPTEDEITEWSKRYNIPVRKFFNTSGILYRELSLKGKLDTMNVDEQIKLLSSNRMLVKRPIFITENKLIIGSSKKEYEALL